MKKRASFWFCHEDEAQVSAALASEFPEFRFIDDQLWETSEPPIANGIHLCRSTLVYLWPSDLVKELPTLQLPPERAAATGKNFEGPTSGPVIQLCRCKLKDNALEMGDVSAFVQDKDTPLGKWMVAVFAFLKKHYACRVDCHNSTTGNIVNENLGGYLVGPSLKTFTCGGYKLVLAFGRDTYIVPHQLA